MFLYDEERIINTASVQRFGCAELMHYPLCQPSFAEGYVVAEYNVYHATRDSLYKGSGEECFKFYLNLLQALVRGDRMVAIKDLHPEATD